MTQRRVGMLTPSSNTVLEPYTSAMFAPFGETGSVHYARFRVVEISMSAASQNQFALDPILEAAERLAEARVDLIAWNGTSAGWLGLDTDRELCARIEAATGVRAFSTMLAYDELWRAMGLSRLGLVTPYLAEIQNRIVANYAGQGVEVVAEEHLETSENFTFAEVTPERVAELVRRVAMAKPEAIAIICTNFRGAPLAQALEAETGIPVIDSVSVTAAATMRLVGLDPSRVTGWGSVFARFAG
ncbi:maleate cis-trans isomerase family protein [Acuticoccus mangrovi]|uniref:Aspartate/glutamate racemase family protein n=1 Tax=Acuticoccus mangrovi TaxID=2796142 RepID=A0A934IN84_9HYPH|nr:aspartate/glutamate racemase family protein [Acuticoccus mangrovi]MBJ3778021.1 aspartate/glutamate racemase family protein [Acuticoccus mangrovi]